MPDMAAITVKKVDATDIVYAAAVPSAGDQTPAKWIATSASGVPGYRPYFTLRTRDNGPKTARSFNAAFRMPVVVQVGGVDTVVATIPIDFSGTLPVKISTGALKEAIYQAGNLFTSQLVRDSLEVGYSPT